MTEGSEADQSPVWRVWIDTGGTFTDCIALAPGGDVRRRKVLSSARIRFAVRREGPGRLELQGAPDLPDGFLDGFDLRVLGTGESGSVLEHRGDRLTVDLVGGPGGAGSEDLIAEFGNGWEAPVLGLHLLFGRRAGEALPQHELRLGTTRGTNALLERKGARSVAVLTRGLGDLLEIGNQTRPDLFARQIRRSPPLPATVLEVEGRLDADGREIEPLGGDQLETLSRRAGELTEQGIRSAAVSLLHAYREPDHERRVAAALRRGGIEFIATSSELSQLAGYLDRTQTTAVEAYLGPVLSDYLRNIADGLGGGFRVMTSAGGLTEASEFRAKDSLLSGPAGGVMGCLEAARAAAVPCALAFDMGGTSTDVSRIGSDVEYDERHEVGSVTIVAPALAIRTVAAGGGSICRADDGRVRVGPESAGADPGPACYGRGGPLTVTDVNLLMGRIDGGRFEVPLDPTAARRALAGVAGDLGAVGHEAELLTGFLQIANERMADTIRQVSTRRGFDPREHTLIAFGGAGPQHACDLAALLGVTEVLVPDDCSLLSARGIGTARPERILQQQVLVEVTEPSLGERIRRCADACRELLEDAEPAEAGHVEVECTVNVRYVGQDAGLELPALPVDSVGERFRAAYTSVFGHHIDRPAEVEWVRGRARGRGRGLPRTAPEPLLETGEPRRATTWIEGAETQVPVLDRRSIPWEAEESLDGPLLVSEDYSSTWVAPGWTVHREPVGRSMILRRTG